MLFIDAAHDSLLSSVNAFDPPEPQKQIESFEFEIEVSQSMNTEGSYRRTVAGNKLEYMAAGDQSVDDLGHFKMTLSQAIA
jgi:hypothetical protein